MLKILSKILLCISLSVYGLPVFANALPEETTVASKIELSDVVMESAMGGSMHAEILSTPDPLTTGTVKALVAADASFDCCTLGYVLEAIDVNGNTVRIISSGSIGTNKTAIVSGEGLQSDEAYRITVGFGSSVPGIEAVDTVWNQFK